ncbi:MAG: glycosyltransferase family 2 protein [Dehalococcoidia bacterium]|nr:glycosyltransferase family 2 protein [Dehalococcoidia bacterium]
MPSTPPAISVVVPTRNRPEHLREALEAVRAGALSAFELLVMDQSNGDDTRAVVESFDDERLRWHRMPRNGACPARNLGAALARADLVAFLDDDCTPLPDWLERIDRAFSRDPDLQFIFGELRPPDVREEGGGYPEFLPAEFTPRQRRRSRKVAMVAAGANMATRKSFLRRVGAFDELLGPARPDVKSNDSSMSYKVWRSGAKWVATPRIAVIHKNGFRREEDLVPLYRGYSHGLGVCYGRFARRGDLRAVETFLVEQWDLLRWPLKEALHLRRPTGVKPWLAHLRGFAEGLRLPGNVGYVSGEVFQDMERTGKV